MVAPRASRLGWIVVLLLGQQHGWASGTSTCASVIISDVRDLDGTYTLDSSISYPYYFRAGGTTTYELYQSSGAWYIADASTGVGYRTYDPAEHPADITLEWVECASSYSCDLDGGLLQPVITCEDDAVDPTPSPTPRLTPSPTTAAVEEVVDTDPPSSPVTSPTPSPNSPPTPSPVDPAPVAGSDGSSPTPPQDDDDGQDGEGNNTTDGDSSGDDGYTKAIIIGTVSTVASAVIIGAGKKIYDEYRSTLQPAQQPAQQPVTQIFNNVIAT